MSANLQNRRRKSPLQPERPSTELAILGLLQDGPSHGYELTRQFAPDTELGKVCQLEMSMLYSLLKKLEREGLITGHDMPVGENKTRRVVELNEAGREEFEEWLSHPVRHTREIRLDFLVKLFFALKRDRALARKLATEQLDFNRQLLEQLQKAENSGKADSFYEKLVLRFRLEQNVAVVRWLEECRAQL
jgi:DNA-binding PadR family transcriptional regulator